MADWRKLAAKLLAYEEDHALSPGEEAAFARVRAVLGESRNSPRPTDAQALAYWERTQRDAIWQAWNELPDGTLNAVGEIAGRLDLKPGQVAAVVYPQETFGPSCPQCGGAVVAGACAGELGRAGCGWLERSPS